MQPVSTVLKSQYFVMYSEGTLFMGRTLFFLSSDTFQNFFPSTCCIWILEPLFPGRKKVLEEIYYTVYMRIQRIYFFMKYKLETKNKQYTCFHSLLSLEQPIINLQHFTEFLLDLAVYEIIKWKLDWGKMNDDVLLFVLIHFYVHKK
jgi:hypothetical protein